MTDNEVTELTTEYANGLEWLLFLLSNMGGE